MTRTGHQGEDLEASPEEVPHRLDDWVWDKHLEKKPKGDDHTFIFTYIQKKRGKKKETFFMKTYVLLIHDSVVLAFVLLHGNVCYVLS